MSHTRTTTLTEFWSYLPQLLNLVQAITLKPFRDIFMILHQVVEESSRHVMYTKDKSDSIFELFPIVVKFADSHNFSTSFEIFW